MNKYDIKISIRIQITSFVLLSINLGFNSDLFLILKKIPPVSSALTPIV